MVALVEQLVASLNGALSFLERRSPKDATRYLEGVIQRQELDQCCALLRSVLGEPLKEFGKVVRFEPQIQKAVEHIGGIRVEQCLFFAKGEDSQVAYAALWPWASNPARITVKVGLLDVR